MEDYLRSYTTIFFYKTDIFPSDFIKHCNNNSNEAHNISLEVRNNLKLISMEQVLYA